MPTTPGVPNPRAVNSRGVRALAVPATAPCPRPLAFPILGLSIPVGSELWQFQRLRHAHDPWRSQSSGCQFPWGPSSGSSSDCAMPTTPGVPNPRAVNSRGVRALAVPATAPCPRPLAFPILGLSIPVGSELWQFQRLRHAHDPWRSQSSGCQFPWGPSSGSSSDCAMPTTPGVPNPRAVNSRGVRALAVPATAPCPRPLAFPILGLSIPVGSELWQFQRLRHAHAPWYHQASACRFPRGPSPRSSSDCPMPTPPGITKPQVVDSRGVQALAVPATAPCPRPLGLPIRRLSIPVGSKPPQLRRLRHARCPWRFPIS